MSTSKREYELQQEMMEQDEVDTSTAKVEPDVGWYQADVAPGIGSIPLEQSNHWKFMELLDGTLA